MNLAFSRWIFCLPSDITIRPARPEEFDRLLAIWRAGTEKAHGFFTAEQIDAQAALVRDVYLAKAETWVATVDGEPAGFLGLLGNFVGGLFVDPQQHGSGIGRALMAHGLALKGTLELGVYARNERAMAFYKALDFEEIERRPIDDNGLPFEVVTLRR